MLEPCTGALTADHGEGGEGNHVSDGDEEGHIFGVINIATSGAILLSSWHDRAAMAQLSGTTCTVRESVERHVIACRLRSWTPS